jgi:hypothetical protein
VAWPLDLLARALAEDEPDRRAGEAKGLAQPVLEVALVAEVDLGGAEAKKTKVGGSMATWVA